LNNCESEEMKLPGRNPGYGNRGKTNRVFPPFPQPLLLLITIKMKAADAKTKTIVYTKYLTLPAASLQITSSMCANLSSSNAITSNFIWNFLAQARSRCDLLRA